MGVRGGRGKGIKEKVEVKSSFIGGGGELLQFAESRKGEVVQMHKSISSFGFM